MVRAGTECSHGDLCVHEDEGDDPDDGVRVLGEVGLEGGRMETIPQFLENIFLTNLYFLQWIYNHSM